MCGIAEGRKCQDNVYGGLLKPKCIDRAIYESIWLASLAENYIYGFMPGLPQDAPLRFPARLSQMTPEDRVERARNGGKKSDRRYVGQGSVFTHNAVRASDL